MEYWKPEYTLIYEFWQCCHIQKLDEVQTVQWVFHNEESNSESKRFLVSGNKKLNGFIYLHEVQRTRTPLNSQPDKATRQIKSFSVPGRIITAKVSKSNSYISCFNEGTLKPQIYKLQGTNEKPILELQSVNKKGCCMSWTTGEKLLGSCDNSIMMWVIQEKPTPQYMPEYHKDGIKGLSWVNEKEFASTTNSGNLYIWDVNMGKPIKKYGGHFGSVQALVGLNDYMLVTGGCDGIIKFWDLRKDRNFEYPKQPVPITKLEKCSSTKFYSGTKDGKIKIWDESEIWTHRAHTSAIKDISVSENLAISAQEETSKILIWAPTPPPFL